jgi:HlyD family secretion protein
MKTWKKVVIAIAGVLLLVVIIGIGVQHSRKGVAEVQTGKVARQDLASEVTASGEIKPKNYVNIGANAFGRITKLNVKEGDHVKKGQVLATLEDVQAAADVAATRDALEGAKADEAAAQATLKTSIADVDRAKSDAEHAQLDWKRYEQLYKDELVPKSDYDTKKNAWESAASNLTQAQLHVQQSRAQLNSAARRIGQQDASLRRLQDVLNKTVYAAPYDGVITNVPVREGETVVVGIQNSPGSTLMTLADTSVITAEIRVDETDIVNVKLNQPAEVAIDAIPKKKFKGYVSEIGNNALLRSSGVATTQTTTGTQEAKDFKVVITLTEVPDDLRPGLSCTAKITTASKSNVLAIPIQALAIREKGELAPQGKAGATAGTTTGTAAAAGPSAASKEEVQGVFVVRNKKAVFVPVTTGITGTTDIEVTGGLNEGEEIITGSYKALRTLKDGASIKVNNSAPAKDDTKS